MASIDIPLEFSEEQLKILFCERFSNLPCASRMQDPEIGGQACFTSEASDHCLNRD